MALQNAELGPKRLELLHQLVPTTAIAALLNPTNPNTISLSKELEVAAGSMGLQLHVLRAATDGDLDAAFQTINDSHIGALFVGTDPFFNDRSAKLAAMALHKGIAAIYQYCDFAAAGGLLSYGVSYTEPMRLVGVYTGRVLKGEKPSSAEPFVHPYWLFEPKFNGFRTAVDTVRGKLISRNGNRSRD